jgi:RNAse (barnase) inhibitor barstar
MKIVTITGKNIRDIPSFFAEINRVFMGGETWTLGASLDALDDMLYGNYGAIDGKKPLTLIWTGFDQSRSSLGEAATRSFLQAKLQQPDVFDTKRIRRQLDALDSSGGQTYIDTVLAIIADHDNITLLTPPGSD